MEIRQLNPKHSLYFSNGVRLENFLDKSPQRPKEYEQIDNPIVIYVGAMSEWFDSDLVNQATKALPKVNFLFIGPDTSVRNRLEKRMKLHLLGKKSYEDLPNTFTTPIGKSLLKPVRVSVIG